MEVLKIVQVIQRPQLRGAEIFACQLSNHLITQGHKVLLICLYKGDADLPFPGEIVYLDRLEKNRFFDFDGWKKFYKIIQNFKPDVIQANAADTLKFAASAKFIYDITTPIIYRNANKISDFNKALLKKIINSFYFSQVSLVLSVSKLCKEDFLKTFRFPKNKVRTVQIGIEKRPKGSFPEDLDDIVKGKQVLLHIGSFVPEKNHYGLLRIFSQYIRVQPDAILLLIGKGTMEDEIKEEVEKLGLKEKIFFLGYRSDVYNIMCHANMFLLPSLIEGLPAVLLEAMECELPVIAYDVGGISEIITPSTGTLVTKGEEEMFIRSMLDISQKPDSSKTGLAKKMVKKKFRNNKIAKRFVRSYQRLLN